MRKSNITLAAIPSLQQKSPAAAFCRRGLFHLVFTCPVNTQIMDYRMYFPYIASCSFLSL